MVIDREVGRSHALVADANNVSRGVIVQMLRSLGFKHVRQAQRLRDACDLLEVRRFDVVVCDHDLQAGSDGTGQALLDELQRGQALPYATVFVMVTSEATYAKVAEAAEAGLDSYLVKPFTAQALADRIRDARQRKRALKPVFDALQARDLTRAADLCAQRFADKQPFALYCARIGAELLLRTQRPQEALKLYEAVQAQRPQSWARLGVARAQIAQGAITPGRRSLDALLAQAPDDADALDVLGQLQLEQGQLDEALQTLERAARLTPDCVLRQQQCGTLAFFAGEAALAGRSLSQAARIGARSRLLDAQTFWLLTLLHHDADDKTSAAGTAQALSKAAAAQHSSARLRRMNTAAEALLGAATDPARACAAAEGLAAEGNQADFDIEAALLVLALWTRLRDAQGRPLLGPDPVHALARRFCTTKAAGELLARAVQPHDEAQAWVREIQAEILHLAEGAMERALKGDPAAAVDQLLVQGERTRNAKLIDMALNVARRHHDRIDQASRLLGEAGALAHRYGRSPALPRLRLQGRPVGGVALRGCGPPP